MTLKAAILSLIEPYELSDDAVERALSDAVERLGEKTEYQVEDDYNKASRKSAALAAMMLLMQLWSLQSESVAGTSSSFSADSIKRRIKFIAQNNGLNSSLVLDDDDEASVTYQSIW
jgi:hypothetical protein